MRFPVRARTLSQLSEMAEPTSVSGGNSEALAWTFFDTAQYTSGTTTQLTFFTTTRANSQLSNLNGRGLPTPQYFEVYFFNFDILGLAGNASPIEDSWEIQHGTGVAGVGAPTWSFTLADKIMGPFPLYTLHGLGGVVGFTTQTTTEFANIGNGQGTFAVDGAVVIPPNQTFQMVLTWPAAVTLAANRDLVVSMTGVLHRRIL